MSLAPRFFTQGFMTVVVFLSLEQTACSYFDAAERVLIAEKLEGRIVETAASDHYLSERGVIVIHRFKTLNQVVYVKGNLEEIPYTPIQASVDSIKSAAERDKGGFVTALSLRGQNRLPVEPVVGSEVESTDDWKYNDGFFEASRLIRRQDLVPVRVGLIDSGVVPATKHLASILKYSQNLTLNENPWSWQTHGTAIGSLFAGVEDAAGELHSLLAPNIELNSVKISFSGDPTDSRRKDLGAIQLAVAIDAAVAQGSKIINLSFTYRPDVPPEIIALERYLVAEAARNGVVFAVAAGNATELGPINIDQTPLYPARYDLENVIVVGSHLGNTRPSPTSNFGSSVDLFACGNLVAANDIQGDVVWESGTSFATPKVVAALALYRGIRPKADHREMLQDLFETARACKSTLSGSDEMRYGCLDVAALVRRALEKDSPSKPLEENVTEPFLR